LSVFLDNFVTGSFANGLFGILFFLLSELIPSLVDLMLSGPISVAINVFVTSINGRRLLNDELERVRELGSLAQVEDEIVFNEQNVIDSNEKDDFVAWLMVC
jgi:hypothetical protein